MGQDAMRELGVDVVSAGWIQMIGFYYGHDFELHEPCIIEQGV